MNERAGRISTDGELQMSCADEALSLADVAAFHETQDEQTTVKSRVTMVFCGDAEQVRAGFALALHAMETRDDLLMTIAKRGKES